MRVADKRIVRREATPAPALVEEAGELLARIYAARGVHSPDELTYGLERLEPYDQLLGIGAATELLCSALAEGWRILVVGDFDADGATSTAVAVRALRAFGAQEVDFLVPNRFEYGYGLTPEIVAVAAERGPDLIITVDNGIASIDGVAAAQTAGIRVLVTDHHLAGDELPAADAIVNPNAPGDPFPSKALAGVGTIFYLMMALRTALRGRGWFGERRPEPNLAALLDLVALGTVADVAPLDYNNRILVAQGLARIRAGRACAGIAALIAVAGRDPARLTAADLGFAIGPRLNAAGRLDDMSHGIDCLLSDDPVAARALAAELDGLNRERRTIEGEMQEQALQSLAQMDLGAEGELPYGMCLYDPEWHQGVIGILASRIKERLHRPVIVFTDAGDDSVKGSARSVQGLHIRDALDAVATRQPGLLTRFGGHAMAAGLTLPRAHLERFTELFDAEVRRHLGPEDLCGRVLSDGPLAAAEATQAQAEALRGGGPWGQGFPEPVFDAELTVVRQRVVGERHLKLRLAWDDGTQAEAIAFNADFDVWRDARRMWLAFRLDVNEYRGQRSLQLVVEHAEPVGARG